DSIRKAWIEHDFASSDTRQILLRYGNYLSQDDHFAKADRSLFNRSTAGLEDVRGLLSADREREVDARSALIRRRTNGPDLFNGLPESSKRDSGVLHAMVRYLRRTGREEDAIEIAKLAPLDSVKLRDAESWYTERKLLARWAIKNGKFNDAYNLSAYSGLRDGADFAEAEFMAGWIALRFLVDPDRARAHFDFLLSGVDSPISQARGHYWLGRAYQAMAEPLRARAHYMVAADFPYTYYGQLAIDSMGEDAPSYSFPADGSIDPSARARYEARELAQAMEILDEINERDLYRRFALALDEELSTEDEVRIFMQRVRDQQEWDLVVRAGKIARNYGLTVPEAIYPLYPLPGDAARFAEPALVLGLSRQESEFRADAVSSARAKGMMQLLNSTARITARKEGLPYDADRLLTDPAYNMTLGAAHLSHLVERFSGSYIMVLAGYNAGPHRVDDWVETYGDPRSPDVDPVDWVELIPFSETRNYVMRVLENTQVYRARLDGVPLGHRLIEDITRGSASTPAAIGQPVPAPQLWLVGGRQFGPPPAVETDYEEPPAAMRRVGGLTTPRPQAEPAGL
ncbi:MAG: lytic transglycosylase domain-containing protein, partial [Parvularcula sp.]|nr:lytic transglycosylase domain-containing protein [Parvularcula sp.]